MTGENRKRVMSRRTISGAQQERGRPPLAGLPVGSPGGWEIYHWRAAGVVCIRRDQHVLC